MRPKTEIKGGHVKITYKVKSMEGRQFVFFVEKKKILLSVTNVDVSWGFAE